MPGFNPDKLNIHDLTIEQPEQLQENFFDPEKEITDDDWVKIRNAQDDAYHKEDVSDFSFYVGGSAVLGRKWNLNNHEKEMIDRRVKLKLTPDREKPTDWLTVANVFALMAINGKQIKLSDREREGFRKSQEAFASSKDENDNFRFPVMAAERAILGESSELNKKDWGLIESVLEKQKKENNVRYFAWTASRMAILGHKPDLTTDDWKMMKNYWREHKDVWEFTFLAHSMAILSADEIKIPEGGGLELIHHKKEKLQTEAPQIPEQRSF